MPLPLTGAASLRVIHFEHFYGSSSFHDGGSAVINVLGAYGAIAGATVGGSVSASKLPARASISDFPFGGQIGFFAERSNGGGFPDGQFLSPGSGYAAFKFDVGEGDQYGWIVCERQACRKTTSRSWITPLVIRASACLSIRRR
ncbi:MAG TPA: hypothetical protein VGL24_02500 [Chthoniobacterales bacterium]